MSDRDQQREVLARVADALHRRGLATIAIVTLESVKPLSFVTAQALVVLGPVIQALVNLRDYDVFCQALEDRANVEWLIRRLETGPPGQSEG